MEDTKNQRQLIQFLLLTHGKQLIPITVMDKKIFEKDPVLYLEKRGYKQVEKNSFVKLPK